jgi:16S rRNA processing protein RimM
MTVQGGVKAGKISKPYGLQGDVHIYLIPDAAQKLKPGIPLFIDMDGQRVPYFMESVELVAADQAIVKVEFINSLEEARKVVGQEVYLDPRDSGDKEVMAVAPGQWIGYLAIDLRLGEIGVVSDHIPNELNPVWVIRHKGGEIMIPATEDFIQKIDHKNSIILLNLPEGITEL